jgi:hypothetical protein
VAIDTDVFFIGVNSSVEMITVAPYSRIELGVYSEIWDEGTKTKRIELVTRGTEVDWQLASPGDRPNPSDEARWVNDLAAVSAGVLVVGEKTGIFMVWATDARQNIQKAKPLTVRIDGGATPVGGQVTVNISVNNPLTVIDYVIDLGDVVIDFTAIPSGGIAVYCNEYPGTVIGRVIVVDGTLVFRVDADGLAWLRSQIVVSVTQQVTLNFTIGGVPYIFVVYVQGTQTVTPTPSPIVITLPNGTVVTDGMTVVIDTNGSMFLVQGGGPYSATVLAGPFTVQVIDGAFLVTPISGTAPGTYSVIIQITDAHGQTRVIHITLVIEGSVTPVATGVTVSPAGPLTLNTNATQQFVGSVQPANANQAVAWSCTRGTIVNGLYTAPSTGGEDQVLCVSVEDSSIYRLVDINVVDPTGGANVVVQGEEDKS